MIWRVCDECDIRFRVRSGTAAKMEDVGDEHSVPCPGCGGDTEIERE